MGMFETIVFVGTAKFLTKAVVKLYLGDAPWAEAIASEFGGEIGKKAVKHWEVIGRLLDGQARSANPEFDRPGVNMEAVDAEVVNTLQKMRLDSKTVIAHGLDTQKLVEFARSKHTPVALGEPNEGVYRVVLETSLRLAAEAITDTKKFRVDVDRRHLGFMEQYERDAQQVFKGLNGLSVFLEGQAKKLEGMAVDVAAIRQDLKPLSIAAQDQAFQAAYLAALVEALDSIELFGLHNIQLPEALKQPLSTAYLSLNVNDEAASSGLTSIESVLEDLVCSAPDNGATATTGKRYLIIRGEAGCGKSTLLKHAAVLLAKSELAPMNVRHSWRRQASRVCVLKALPSQADKLPFYGEGVVREWVGPEYLDQVWRARRGEVIDGGEWIPEIRKTDPDHFKYTDALLDWLAANRLIPVFIPLRKCKNNTLPDTLDELCLMAAKGMPKPPDGWLDRRAAEGRVLFLIDGLDEILPEKRKNIDAGLEEWFNRLDKPGNLFVVTSRPLVEEPAWVGRKAFVKARVAPMSRAGREMLIDNWHKAVQEALERCGRPEAAAEAFKVPGKGVELKQRLARPESAAMAQLASSPLMCAMLCALSTQIEFETSTTPTEIVRTLCDVLLQHREQKTPDLDAVAFWPEYLKVDRRRSILSLLAEDMVKMGASLASFDLLRKHAADVLSRMHEGKPEDAERVAAALIERSGVLVRPKAKAAGAVPQASPLEKPTMPDVDWVHNTFKEFLAAQVMTETDHRKFLVTHADRSECRNVCVYVCAADGSGRAVSEVLTSLVRDIERIDPRKADKRQLEARRQREYLALRIAKASLPPEPIKSKVAEITKNLLPPRSFADAEAIASLGEEVVPYLGWAAAVAAGGPAPIACVRALRLIEHEDARFAMQEYADKATDTPVLVELAQAMHPLTIAEVLRRVSTECPEGVDSHGDDWLPVSLRNSILDLTPLSGRRGLTRLDVSGTQVQSLEPLKEVKGLQTLSVSSTPVQSLEPLKELKGLQTLSVNYTPVQSLEPLKKLEGLQSLDLSGTQVQSLEPLKDLKGLQALYVNYTPVQSLEPLKGLKGLQALDVSDTQVQSLEPLKELRGLQALDVRGTKVRSLEPLMGMTGLQTLDVRYTPVRNLELLKELKDLQTLGVCDTPVQSLEPLLGCSSLRRVYISTHQRALANVLKKRPEIQIIEL